MATVADPPPPTGLVAFAFTDVEGSTVLWDRLGDAMRAVIERHDQLMHGLLLEHGGYLIRTEGDSVKAAFADAAAALRWCFAAQRALFEQEWPPALLQQTQACEVRDDQACVVQRGLRVRMGIHVGRADARVVPATGRYDWFGADVNLAARVADAPHGGQIVLSQAAWSAVGRPDGDVVVTPLGSHQLKGVALPVELVQVLPVALAGRKFPPLRTESARRTNLEAPRDTFIGRGADLEQVERGLAGARLVTLLGPGGIGKTRLAREVGLRASRGDRFPGGVWFVDLTQATEASDLVSGVARVLGVTLPGQVDASVASGVLGARLARVGRTMLVLDNLEQIVGPGARLVGAWLEQAPDITVLATSRAPLGLRGEVSHTVEPLPIESAVDLFFARARDAGGNVTDDPETRGVVREIAVGLDGLSLAVELAAARTDVLSVTAIRDRLSQQFRLLSRPGHAEERHGTLRGALDWSWDLLDADERAALAQCSVFRGGFTVEAAEAVLELPGGGWPMDVVQSLRAKSLLVARSVDGERRLDMLRLVRAYAEEKLEAMGGSEAVCARHAAYYAGCADRAAAALWGPRSGVGQLQIRREIDNLLAVWERFHERQPRLAARVVGRIGRMLVSLGNRPGVEALFAQALVAAGDDPRLRLEALLNRAYAVRMGARAMQGRAWVEEAVAIADTLGDPLLKADLCLELAAGVYLPLGEHARAVEALTAAVAAFREQRQPGRLGVALSWLGMQVYFKDQPSSYQLLDEALEQVGLAGDAERALVLARVVMIRAKQGNFEGSRAASDECIAWYARLGSRHDLASTLLVRSLIELEAQRLDAAATAARAGMDHARLVDGAGLEGGLRAVIAGVTAATATGDLDGLSPADWYRREVQSVYEPRTGADGAPLDSLVQASVWTRLGLDGVYRQLGLGSPP